jgi:hypothetical protein
VLFTSAQRSTLTRRLGLRWVVASAVALSLVVAAAPAQAAGPVKSNLRSALAPATVLLGASVVVSGAVSPSVAGSPVVLQRLVAGQWKTLTHKNSGKAGVYSFTVHASGKVGVWSLRVVRAASAKAAAVTGKTLTVRLTKTAFKVSSAVVTRVNAGSPVVLTGAVTPKATGQVVLQVLHLGKWRTLATTKLVGSAYSFTKNLPPKTYPLRVMKAFTAAVATGESKSSKVTVYPTPVVPPKLAPGSPDNTTLALPGNRLVFSTIKSAATPVKSFTFTNSGTAAVTLSNLAIEGTDASSFSLAPGQPTSVVVPAGGQVSVGVRFNPTPTTNCPTASGPNEFRISDPNRNAALVFTSTDPGLPGGSAVVAGINSCTTSGANEPVLDQVLSALGYTDVVHGPTTDRRFLGQSTHIPGTDEISAPYFNVANAALPVSLVPLAQYSSADTRPYHAEGWYLRGATLGPDSTCNASCHELWDFPAEATAETYTDNQKLLPTPVGTTTFTPTGTFGLFSGEFTDVNFTDDSLNIAHGTDNKDLVPIQYLHDFRIYPAYGAGHVAVPNTYLVCVDVTRVTADKNFDFQDVVMLLSNVTPAS